MARRIRDNVIEVKGPAEAEERNLAAHKKRITIRRTAIIVALLIVVIVIAVAYVSRHLRNYNSIKVISSAETTYESNASYLRFGKNLLKYTSGGVSYINEKGEVVWTAGIDLSMPIASVNGNYAVVADKGGNQVAVFNTDGQISTVTMPYAICDVDVAGQGSFAAILESDTTNYINMYSSSGEIIYEIQTSIDKSGYPMDISVSDNGQKLFTSYFKLDGVNINNNLTAYNFGEVGQNENADRMVGGYTFEEEMIPKVQFVSNNVVVAFSDTKIHVYNMKEKPSEKAEIDYNGDISSIFYSSEFVGTIMPNPDTSSSMKYVMHVYDLSGKELFAYPFAMEYENIYADEDEIIITGGNQCLIIQKSGRTKFAYSFDSMVKSMIPTSRNNEYIVTYEGRTDTVKLRTEDK